MKQFILKEGAILILDFICISNIIMLILGKKTEAIWTIVFVIILQLIYFFFIKKFGSIYDKR